MGHKMVNDFFIENGRLIKYNGDGGAVTIPEGVTEIGDEAFKECRRLKEIIIPDSVAVIGSNAFLSCRSLNELILPDSVTIIKWGAFEDCRNLKQVKLSKSLKNLQWNLFFGCSSLTEIEIPDGVETIGNHVFYACSSLTEIEIPDGVKTIGDHVFYACRSLSKVTLPESLTDIGDEVFAGCRDLEDVRFLGSEMQWKKLRKSILVNYSNAASQAVAVKPMKPDYRLDDFVYVVKGDNTAKIIDFAAPWARAPSWLWGSFLPSFQPVQNQNTKKTHIVEIPSQIEGHIVTEIGHRAFISCQNIESIRIPNSVGIIGKEAFSGCGDLKSIVIPEEVIEIQEGTFDNCKTLETVVLPSGITRIEERAFARCSGLQSINIPESVEDVAPGAFEDCDRLWNVQISEKTIEKLGPEKVRKLLITRAALVGFAKGKIRCEVMKPEIAALLRQKKYRVEMIHQAIREDDAEALGNLISVQKKLPIDELDAYISMTEKQERINVKALLLQTKNRMFSRAQQEAYDLETEEKELGFREKSLADWREFYSISSVAGQYCLNRYKQEGRNDEVLTVPGRIKGRPVKKIGPEAFMLSYKVKTVFIEDGVEEIGERAFYNCGNLSEVFVPASVRIIGDRAFDAHIKMHRFPYLFEVEKEKLVIHAAHGSFAAGYAKEHEIPLTETEIRGDDIQIPEKKEQEAWPHTETGWKKIYSWEKITESSIRLTSYKGEAENIIIPEMIGKKRVVAIGGWAFCPAMGTHSLIKERREAIRSVVIPGGIEAIERSAFSDCSNLSSVTIHEGVTRIEEKAFSGCTSLKEIIIPESVAVIEDEAFSNCKHLEIVKLPETLRMFGEHVFFNCRELWNVQISESVLELVGENNARQSFMNPTACEHFLHDELQCESIKSRIQIMLRQKKYRTDMIMRLVKKDDAEALEKLLAMQRRLHTEELSEAFHKARGLSKEKTMELLQSKIDSDTIP